MLHVTRLDEWQGVESYVGTGGTKQILKLKIEAVGAPSNGGTIPTELGRLTSVYTMCAQTWRARARTTILSYGLVAAMRPDCAGGSIATS